jgi:head-tail adaptor
MRDRITLQARTEPTFENPDGGHASIVTVWAEFRPASGREFREGNSAIGEERATFAVNYREGLKQVDRLIHHGRGGERIWDIQSAQSLGFKDGLIILAVAYDVGGN